ncbi:hypothetical protein ACH5RR_035931 [Cinchona calisaya]|uniref:CLAVATA3/ESR (CLE)-related protein 9 n=1 Tax=Cinchona calisaya TaxID=153742 RepID=A0ABD2Y6G7_9GENT
MKTSPSSKTCFLQIFLIFLLFLSASTDQISQPRKVHQRSQGKNFLQHSWNAISSNSMQSPHGIKCYQLHRILHCTPFLTASPPPPSDYEIDPRFGVEKRLVPSGPNPLHN